VERLTFLPPAVDRSSIVGVLLSQKSRQNSDVVTQTESVKFRCDEKKFAFFLALTGKQYHVVIVIGAVEC